MSNVQKADPYRKLLKVVIALLVLFVLLVTAYLLLESYRRGQYEKEQRRVIEANNQMIEEYNQQVLAQRSEQKPDIAPEWPAHKAEGIDIISLKGFAVKGEQPLSVSRAQALSGGLMVVNRWYALPADFSVVEAEIDSIMTLTDRRVPTEKRELSLFPVAIQALDQMLKDAKADGLENFLVRGAYRTMATQQEIWDREVARHAGRLDGEQLLEQARKLVSEPGRSDYQSGMSVFMDAYSNNDPVLNRAEFQETKQAQWINENGYKYGFVFRFPTAGYPAPGTVDKSYKTGIDLEMDAYRYVGIPHAFVMREMGFCLEEYIEYLIENGHIAVYEDDKLVYEIFRVEENATQTDVLIPAGAVDTTFSSDNTGGLVVAVSY